MSKPEIPPSAPSANNTIVTQTKRTRFRGLGFEETVRTETHTPAIPDAAAPLLIQGDGTAPYRSAWIPEGLVIDWHTPLPKPVQTTPFRAGMVLSGAYFSGAGIVATTAAAGIGTDNSELAGIGFLSGLAVSAASVVVYGVKATVATLKNNKTTRLHNKELDRIAPNLTVERVTERAKDFDDAAIIQDNTYVLDNEAASALLGSQITVPGHDATVAARTVFAEYLQVGRQSLQIAAASPDAPPYAKTRSIDALHDDDGTKLIFNPARGLAQLLRKSSPSDAESLLNTARPQIENIFVLQNRAANEVARAQLDQIFGSDEPVASNTLDLPLDKDTVAKMAHNFLGIGAAYLALQPEHSQSVTIDRPVY